MENSFCKQKRKKAAVTCSVTQMKSYTGITASVVSCQRPSVASRLKLSPWKKMQTSLMGDCIILSLAFNQMKLVPWTDIANKGPHSFIFFFSFFKKKIIIFWQLIYFQNDRKNEKNQRTPELKSHLSDVSCVYSFAAMRREGLFHCLLCRIDSQTFDLNHLGVCHVSNLIHCLCAFSGFGGWEELFLQHQTHCGNCWKRILNKRFIPLSGKWIHT